MFSFYPASSRACQGTGHAPAPKKLSALAIALADDFARYTTAQKKGDRLQAERIATRMLSALAPDFSRIASLLPSSDRDDIIAECHLVLAEFLSGHSVVHSQPTDLLQAIKIRARGAALNWMRNRSATSVASRMLLPDGERKTPMSLSGEGNTFAVESLASVSGGNEAEMEVMIAIEQATKNSQPEAVAAFYLNRMDGFSFRQCAEILGKPARSIRSQVENIMQKLRRLFPDRADVESPHIRTRTPGLSFA